MALQKQVTLLNGMSGNYIRIWRTDRREGVDGVAVYFALFKDATYAELFPKKPLIEQFIKFRLEGADYQQFLSKEALAARFEENPTTDAVKSQIYLAALSVPSLYDGDPEFLWDAQSV